MDDFTLYLDLMQQSSDSNVKMVIPETRDILRMIDNGKIELAPSEIAVKNIMDFSYQFEIIETENEIWDLNLN